MLFSIITVCYNSEKTIEQTVQSIVNQTYQNYEHIIIDGGSTDSTISIIHKYDSAYNGRLRLYSEKDNGIYDAMNKGIGITHGEIVGIINSDDWYAPDALEKVADIYKKTTEKYCIITGDLVRTDYNGRELFCQKHTEISVKGLTRGMQLQHPAVFVSKSVYESVGAFDLSYRFLADYDFIWRCFASEKVKFLFTHTITSYMREGGASDTLKLKNIWIRTAERYRLRSKYIGTSKAFLTSCKFFITEMLKQLLKKILSKRIRDVYYRLKYKGKKSIKRFIQLVNDDLRKFPWIRDKIIWFILTARYFIYAGINLIKRNKTGYLTSGKRLTPAGEHCFFGYYDKSPYSADGKYLIYHRIRSDKSPGIGEKADICIQNLITGKRKVLGQTLAWNLQQGAMLRYLNNHTVVWNDFRNGQYCAVVHSFADKKEYTIPEPLYDINEQGNTALTLEFERLNYDAEGYGYIQKQTKEFPNAAVIKRIDLNDFRTEIIIDSKELSRIYPLKHKPISFEYFNHLKFNPSGNRFLFIYRYVYNGKRFSRLFSSDLSGKDIHLLADENMVSHFTWKNDKELLVWCRKNQRDAYYLIEDSDLTNWKQIGADYLTCDGHPTYHPQQPEWFITDTYPDYARLRHLFLFNEHDNRKIEIANFTAPIKYDGPRRCDFHPRFNFDCQKVCIDSIHEGFRGIYEINCNKG
ncbi:glycosyltransferase family 2 protein [Diplocloster modestus]|uniref:Glycosyltransferase n=1 Tax=Diplocloster modestus TaxID=2850322 RepID=A0ABS6K3W6_9FIRM|nr:glycosyltransferase [Diplocloster modestus]